MSRREHPGRTQCRLRRAFRTTRRNRRSETITAKTVRTQREAGHAVLFIGLYLDKNDDSEFFEWDAQNGNTDGWVGFGGDDEGVLVSDANGDTTIDGDTEFSIFRAEQAATLNELQKGTIDGINDETFAGLYVGVASSGEGTEEAVVKELNVRRA